MARWPLIILDIRGYCEYFGMNPPNWKYSIFEINQHYVENSEESNNY